MIDNICTKINTKPKKNIFQTYFPGILFCGPECRKEAMDTYHPYECGITDIIHRAQIGGWALAYRAMTSKPYQFFVDNKEKFLKKNELLGSKNYNSEVTTIICYKHIL